MSDKVQKQDHDCSLTIVGEEQKRGFWSMFVIMMGFTFFSASMWAGGSLGNGLTLKGFLLAVLIGNLILGVYTSLLAYTASKTSLSVHLLSRYSFGEFGSFIPSAALAFTQIGWFGVGIAMFAIPTAVAVMDLPALQGSWILSGGTVSILFDGVDIPARLLYILVGVSGVLMTCTAYWGIKALSIISVIAVPSIAVFGCYSAVRALFFDTIPPELASETVTTGWDLIRLHEPAVGQKLGMAAAITIAIGSFISGGSCTPDFARFSRSPKVAVSTTALAFFIGNSLMFIFGAAGAMVYKQSDISLVLKLQGLLVPAIVVLGLNIWTTNDNALYTSGLGLSNITRLPKKYVVLVNGIIGTIAAIWLYDNFVSWLNILNTFLPPVGGIIIVDYFVSDKNRYKDFHDFEFKKFNFDAIIGWAIGSLVALIGLNKIPFIQCEFLTKGLPAINGMVCSIVVYLIVKAIIKRK